MRLGISGICALTALWTGMAKGEEVSDPLPDGWVEHKPGGDTICARGGEFAFFVREGNLDKVIVDFIGGGACWDAVTCDRPTATFTDNVDELRRAAQQGLPGVYGPNPTNPYKDWTHVVIPYCTGDVHWGDADVTYTRTDGTSFVINHRGGTNARAVMDWVKQRIAAPKKVLVTGCSAGSYGSIFWTPHLKKHYSDAEILQFGDSGVGVLTREFQKNSFPLWNVTANAPSWIPALDPTKIDYTDLKLSDFYTETAAFYPDVQLAQYNTSYDFIQTYFYMQMGGQPDDWNGKMLGSIDGIHAATPNFHSFIAGGDAHCATVYDDFYAIQSDGVKLRDWVAGYVDGTPLRDVRCENCEQGPHGVR